ncbi:protein SSUH2 homolog isoform X2 [Podarcis lilfordi]|uniref:Protein SSUH2 homolog isoform X2 n=1 Tax=Podarcis lilfordi TaxID=74358 RepID=A0AA35JX56_9SAUR|nr:protein SSUH2 homolog isoform X2 [Podarcis lilfordi]
MFQEKTQRIRVPHTSALTACPTCGSTGRSHCSRCNGNSKQQCGRCHGRGVRFVDDTCEQCSGSGIENCQECSGTGTTVCNDCEGKGQLLSFIELQVEWKNNVYEYVADERSGFPIELFKTVTGETLFVDDSPMVYPVISFPDFGISQASSNAVEQHQAQFASPRQASAVNINQITTECCGPRELPGALPSPVQGHGEIHAPAGLHWPVPLQTS